MARADDLRAMQPAISKLEAKWSEALQDKHICDFLKRQYDANGRVAALQEKLDQHIPLPDTVCQERRSGGRPWELKVALCLPLQYCCVGPDA